ncbi:NAD(P)-binding protein [Rhodotorula sp. JG-1b]|nr:NAD(P)-binding protein [Rhodotorula sp. JG-1b]
MSSSFTCHWGILSTGWIANKFVLDLLTDPSTREASDVKHQVVAVGSRSTDSAKRFVEATWKEAGVTAGQEQVKLYGTYEELYRDESVNCIYVGTPHSHHYANVHAALSAGKNVLCEKSLVVNAKQAQVLVDLARQKNLFLMEATWTRCLPFASKLQAVLASGAIGEVRAVQSEMCFDWSDIVRQNPDHRLINPNLAGGALLDLSPYSYTILALSILPRSKASPEPLPIPKVVSSAIKTALGVDASSTTTINFEQPDGRVVPGTMSSAIDRVTPPERCALIQGSLGYITIRTPANVPQSFTVERYGAGHPMWMSDMDHKSTTYDFVMPKGTWGFAYEADEVARCLRDGKKESDIIPLRETILQMQIFDEIRRQNDLVYPEALETLDLK